MKLLKHLLKLIAGLLCILIVSILVILLIDSHNTNYLKIDNHSALAKKTYLIKNANIIPMNNDTILMNHSLFIEDGIIQEIQPYLIEKPEVAVIDARNQYLMPGLIDMHVHIWDRYELGLYLANGVTAVRNVWGLPMHLRMKEEINKEEILAPAFLTSGPKLTGPEFIGDDNLQLFSPEEARDKVRAYKERGYDLIKTYYGLTPEIYDAVIEEARNQNMDIVAHPSQKVPYNYHFQPQIKSIEHAEDIVQQPLSFDLDTLKLDSLVNTFDKNSRASFCPTLVVFNNIYQMMLNDSMLSSASLEYINPLIRLVDSENQFNRWQHAKQNDETVVDRIKRQHDFHLKIVSRLHEEGIPIIAGTDAGIGVTLPGYSLLKELSFYNEAGLTNYEVLKTATINAANTHKAFHQLGAIQEGMTANIILIDDNPLENLEALQDISTVFVNGRVLGHEQLREFEIEAKHRSNLIASALRYLENLLIEK